MKSRTPAVLLTAVLILAPGAARAEEPESPCSQAEPYGDFDFWLGDGDVLVGGEKRAQNRITKELGGCLVRERYENARGYRGKSLNHYDPETGHWKQNWVDVGGGITRYEGGLEAPGVMRSAGVGSLPGGEPKQARVTWTRRDDGTVHHLIEHSEDGAATWRVVFDAVYVRSDRQASTVLN